MWARISSKSQVPSRRGLQKLFPFTHAVHAVSMGILYNRWLDVSKGVWSNSSWRFLSGLMWNIYAEHEECCKSRAREIVTECTDGDRLKTTTVRLMWVLFQDPIIDVWPLGQGCFWVCAFFNDSTLANKALCLLSDIFAMSCFCFMNCSKMLMDNGSVRSGRVEAFIGKAIFFTAYLCHTFCEASIILLKFDCDKEEHCSYLLSSPHASSLHL